MVSTANESFPRQYARSRRLTLGHPRTVQIAPDGSSVFFLRSTGASDPTLRLWAASVAADDEPTLVADPATLGVDDANLPAAERARRERARESAAGIVSYALAGDGSLAAFALAGELYVADLQTGETRSIATAGNVFDPRPNHDGSLVAYVSGRELRVVGSALDTATGDHVVAADPDPLVSWGRADFIAAEEMGRSRGFWWSPDDNTLLATRVDDTPVDSWWIADPANPDRQPHEIRYPAAGTTNPHVGLAILRRGETDWTARSIEWAAGSEYLADVVWASGHDPLIVRQTRDQRTVEIIDLDVGTGEVAPAPRHTIRDEIWVELMPGSPTWYGDQLLTIEDRADLDRRVACLDGEPVDGTGEWHIKAVLGVDQHRIIASAWTEPTEVHVVTINVHPGGGQSSTMQLTTEPGVHAAVVRNGKIVITSAVPERPGSTTIVHDLPEPGAALQAGHRTIESSEACASSARRSETAESSEA